VSAWSLFFQESFTFFNCAPPAAGEEISRNCLLPGSKYPTAKGCALKTSFLPGCRNQQLRCRACCLFLSPLNGKNRSYFLAANKQSCEMQPKHFYTETSTFCDVAENEHH
jgi:hypothetical protein